MKPCAQFYIPSVSQDVLSNGVDGLHSLVINLVVVEPFLEQSYWNYTGNDIFLLLHHRENCDCLLAVTMLVLAVTVQVLAVTVLVLAGTGCHCADTRCHCAGIGCHCAGTGCHCAGTGCYWLSLCWY